MPPPELVVLQRVLVVEDDRASQLRLKALLRDAAGAESVAIVAGSIAEAQAAAAAQDFDIALVDIGLPDGSGIDLIAWLQTRTPHPACLVITAWGDGDTVLAALRAGAIGYLLKDRDDAELLRALKNIQRGGAPLDPFVARRILAQLASSPLPVKPEPATRDTLSEREHQILDLVAHGRNNRQIAEATGLSRFTIEDYTKRIYRKLAVGSRAEAVFEAHSRGLLR